MHIRCPVSLFLLAVAAAAHAQIAPASPASGPIDRHALVSRHNITLTPNPPDPMLAMAVGNGEFAFNFDVTGLQSFPEFYEKTMPIGILSNWAWHVFPNPNNYSIDKFQMTVIPKYDRQFVYPASATTDPPPDAAYLRGNLHRFGLARIGLDMTHADGSKVLITDLKNIHQTLDLWTGLHTSTFEVDGQPVKVQTAAHGDRDEVATIIDSPLLATGRIKLRIAFPYASSSFGPDYQDWTKPDAHTTKLTRRGTIAAAFERSLDTTRYFVRTKWSNAGTLGEVHEPHAYLLTSTADHLEFSAWFTETSIPGYPPARPAAALTDDADPAPAVLAASADHWKNYWTTGGVIDLSGNDDPRAAELERRIVLSQYVMAVHDAGSFPPQETGLGANSWFGKFHMEMYWWHSAHWALWGHADILEKSLVNLTQLMPPGQAMAKREGAKGVKWSKMTDPTGNESPSGVGPALAWQQPHPIYLAELVYRAKKDKATLDKYKDIVFQTSDYMASFVDYDPARKQYVLGPGVGSADEKHTDYAHNLNPTMELGYWKWAMETAQLWRERLNIPRDELTDKVLKNLAPLTVRNGIYPALELPAENSSSGMTTFLYGALPGKDIDKDAMRTTMRNAARGATGAPQASVTWGTAMWAMSAIRLGETDTTLALLAGQYAPGKNPFSASGYTIRRPDQTPMYFPANGAWLTAAALMTAGWDGNTTANPGFPKNWKVRWEGILPLP